MAVGELLSRSGTALMLTAVFLATFMDGLDSSIVGIALPSIAADLGVDAAAVSWVSVTYMLVLAGTLIIFARLAADTGVRRIMIVGLAVFTLASLACGLAASFPVLLAARLVQGLGAAMIAAAGPICCTQHLPVRSLGLGMGVITVGTALGFAFGPSLGGIMLGFAPWQWIFLINLGPGAVAVIAAAASIPRARSHAPARLDWAGAVTLAAAVSAAVLAIETVSGSPIWLPGGSAIAAAVMLALFIRRERRTSAPLLNLSIFRSRGFAPVFLSLMLMNMAYLGVLYLFPFYGEIYLGLPSAEVGLIMIVSSVTTAVFSLPVARWSDRRGRRPFCAVSGLLLATGMALLLFFDARMTLPVLVAAMFFKGLGWAFVGGPMGSNLVEHARQDRDMASSLMNEDEAAAKTIAVTAVPSTPPM